MIFWLTNSVHENLREILLNNQELTPSDSRRLVTDLRRSLTCLAGYCDGSPDKEFILQLIFEIYEYPFLVGTFSKKNKPLVIIDTLNFRPKDVS